MRGKIYFCLLIPSNLTSNLQVIWKLGDYDGSERLIERSRQSQASFIGAPAERMDGLRREDRVLKEL